MQKYLTYTFMVCLISSFTWAHQPVYAQEDTEAMLDLLRQQTQGQEGNTSGPSENEIDILLDQIEQGQEAVDQQATSGFQLSLSPRIPEAHQEVTFEVSGYGVNLHEAFYTWMVDGTQVASGYGQTQIQHTLGDIGEATQVHVTIRTTNGNTTTRERIVVPNSVDILWEAIDSQTPPFYRGKALPSYDSIIKLTTISNLYGSDGTLLNPQSAVYTWEKAGRKRDLADYSGFGGSTAYLLGDFLNVYQSASVTITSQANDLETSENISFRLVDPQLVLYEKHPTNGIMYERALDTKDVTTNEGLRIVAEPFFMDKRDPFDITYTWSVNNSQLNNEARMDQGEIQLITPEDQTGQTVLEVEAENNSKLLQSDSNSLRINIE